MSVAAEDEQTIEDDDGCVPISRHGIPVQKAQLGLAHQLELLTVVLFRTSGQHARCNSIPSFELLLRALTAFLRLEC